MSYSISSKDLKVSAITKFHKLCLESFSINHDVFSTQTCMLIWQNVTMTSAKIALQEGNSLLPRGSDPFDQHQEITADRKSTGSRNQSFVSFRFQCHAIQNRSKSKPVQQIKSRIWEEKKVNMQRFSPRFRSQHFFLSKICR